MPFGWVRASFPDKPGFPEERGADCAVWRTDEDVIYRNPGGVLLSSEATLRKTLSFFYYGVSDSRTTVQYLALETRLQS